MFNVKLKSFYIYINMNNLPDELKQIIDNRLYKNQLPKITVKEPKINITEWNKLNKKLYQICNYKPFDKLSRINKVKQLTKLYKVWVIYITDMKNKDFVNLNNNKLKNVIGETENILTNYEKFQMISKLFSNNSNNINNINLDDILTDIYVKLNKEGMISNNDINNYLFYLCSTKPDHVCRQLSYEINFVSNEIGGLAHSN